MEFFDSSKVSQLTAGFQGSDNEITELDVNVLTEGEAFVPVVVDVNGVRTIATSTSIIRNGEPVRARKPDGSLDIDEEGRVRMTTPKASFMYVFVFHMDTNGKWKQVTGKDIDGQEKPVMKRLFPRSLSHRIFPCQVARKPEYAGITEPANPNNLEQFDMNNITVRSAGEMVIDSGSAVDFVQAYKSNGGYNAAFLALADKCMENGKFKSVVSYNKDHTHPYFVRRFNPRPGQDLASVDYKRVWEIENV